MGGVKIPIPIYDVKTETVAVNTTYRPSEEGAHNPNWPNGLLTIIIVPVCYHGRLYKATEGIRCSTITDC